MRLPADWIVPDWPAPPHVRAFVTTREGGTSEGAYASMNLGLNGGDDPGRVERNRAIVRAYLPADPAYMAQVHGTDVADLDQAAGGRPTADAAVASMPARVAVVLTADCMPLFLCDRAGERVAVVHAGWRGMAAGVIENAVVSLAAADRDVLAWMGPAIGPDAFEVGAEVKAAFVAHDAGAARAFRPHAPGKFMANLYDLARQRLESVGVRAISGGGFCTFRDPQRFFSYRREKRSGRMGAFIWKE